MRGWQQQPFCFQMDLEHLTFCYPLPFKPHPFQRHPRFGRDGSSAFLLASPSNTPWAAPLCINSLCSHSGLTLHTCRPGPRLLGGWAAHSGCPLHSPPRLQPSLTTLGGTHWQGFALNSCLPGSDLVDSANLHPANTLVSFWELLGLHSLCDKSNNFSAHFTSHHRPSPR